MIGLPSLPFRTRLACGGTFAARISFGPAQIMGVAVGRGVIISMYFTSFFVRSCVLAGRAADPGGLSEEASR